MNIEKKYDTGLSILQKAKYVSISINVLGVITCIFLFFNSFFIYAFYANCLMFLISIIVPRFFGGIIKLEDEKASKSPSTMLAFALCAVAMAVRASVDYNLYDFNDVWKPVLLVCFLILLLIIIKNNEYNFRRSKTYLSMFLLIFITIFFSYGFIMTLNCYYDNEQAEVCYSKVLSKRKKRSRKNSSYYLTLNYCSNFDTSTEVETHARVYNSVNEGDAVKVFLFKGKLGIRWYEILNY